MYGPNRRIRETLGGGETESENEGKKVEFLIGCFIEVS